MHDLRDRQRDAGGVFGAPGSGPDSFGDPSAEQAHAHQSVALLDETDLGVVRIGGSDRASFLQGLVTNDMTLMEPGGGCRSALLDVKGKIQHLFDVLAFEHELWLTLPRVEAPVVAEFLDGYLIMEDV